MMTQDEARRCADAIKVALATARRQLVELYDGEGWLALGYASWRECVAAEFGYSIAYLYRQREAGRIERDVLNSPIGEIKESVLRPLSGVPDGDQLAVWNDAVDEAVAAGKPKPTANDVHRAVTRYNVVSKPTQPQTVEFAKVAPPEPHPALINAVLSDLHRLARVDRRPLWNAIIERGMVDLVPEAIATLTETMALGQRQMQTERELRQQRG